MEMVQNSLPQNLTEATSESWFELLALWTERLGEPDFVHGPALTLRWYLRDGAVELCAYGSTGDCRLWVDYLDAESLADFDEEVYHDSRGGSADCHNSYLWFFWTPTAQIADGTFCHGGFMSLDPEDLVDVLETTLLPLVSDLPLMPPHWKQTVVIEWSTPLSARIAVSANGVLLRFEGGEDQLADLSPATCRQAIRAFAGAIAEHADEEDFCEYERQGSFSYGKWTMVTSG